MILRTVTTLIFLLWPQFVSAYPIDLTNWKLVEGDDNLKVYTHMKNQGEKLSINLSKANYKNWHKKSSDQVYDSFLKTKRKMLALLGIKDWQVKTKVWHPKAPENPKISRLEVKGTYQNSRGKMIKFHEIHEFTNHEKRQYLFTKVQK